MSGLNLTPNPSVIMVQAGIFLTSVAIIKKLYLEPYLKIKEKRIEATTGSADLARDLEADSASKLQTLTARLSESQKNVFLERTKIIKSAEESAHQKIKEAETEAAGILHSLRSDLKLQIDQARGEIPKIVQDMKASVLSEVMS